MVCVPPCILKGGSCAARQRGDGVKMEDFLQVGIITTSHGIGGEVKVFPTTDDPERFRQLKDVILDTGKERRTLQIQGVRFFKQFVILKFQGLDSINDVEKLRKCPLLVSRENAVKLEKDEYFVADLEGLSVRDEDGGEIGILKSVLETGANDVYVIELHDKRELLLPAIRQCVLEVNIAEGFIRVHILEGLLDET